MSFQAVTWAIEQKTGSPSAKATLWAITNYANEHWCAYPKQETIANDSEQSVDSVGKRIADLVGLGLLRRIKLKRFGRRTHDFIVLKPSRLFAAGIEEILPLIPSGCDVMEDSPHATAECGSVDHEETATESEDSNNTTTANCGSAENATLPQSAVHATALVRQHEPVIKPEEIPPNPPLGGDQVKIDQVLEKDLDDLARAYPIPITDLPKLRRAMAAQPLKQRPKIVAAAAAYADFIRAEERKGRKRAVKDAHRWVAANLWQGFTAAVERKEALGTMGYFAPSSREGRAILAVADIARYRPFRLSDGTISFSGKIGPQLLVFADIPADQIRTACRRPADEQERRKDPENARQFFAWRDFIHKVFAGRNLPALTTIEAPWPWPPSVEGKIYAHDSTGPPDRIPGTLATEEDMDAFARG